MTPWSQQSPSRKSLGQARYSPVLNPLLIWQSHFLRQRELIPEHLEREASWLPRICASLGDTYRVLESASASNAAAILSRSGLFLNAAHYVVAPPSGFYTGFLLSLSLSFASSSPHPQSYASPMFAHSNSGFSKRLLTKLCTKQPHPAAANLEDTCGGYLASILPKCSAHSPLQLQLAQRKMLST